MSVSAARSASWASLAGGLGAVLLPKCPLCFAAYGSALGALGVSPAAYRPLVDVLLASSVTASFGIVLALSRRRRDAVTPLVSAVGAVLILAGRLAFDAPAITAAGAIVLVAAAVVNSIRCRGYTTVPKRAPTPAVSPMASAPQKVTRTAPAVTGAPPVRAANPPRTARKTREVPETR